MTDLNTGAIEMIDVRKKLAPDFLYTFRSLLNVMSIQEVKLRAKKTRQASSQAVSVDSSSTAVKRGAEDSQSSNPAKRIRTTAPSQSPPSGPKTPDQPTHPLDPAWTGATEESKDEENTKALLKQILIDSMDVLELDFTAIKWQRSGHKAYLFHT
jgi:hypothetical protein